jgi:hypothetical protein
MAIELGGSVFEITHDLVGDLFRAKNAGVTLCLSDTVASESDLGIDLVESRCSTSQCVDLTHLS